MKRSSILLLFILFFSQLVLGQNTKSKEDYKRAVSFLAKNLNNKKVFNLYIQPNWFPDSSGVWYVTHSVKNKKYIKLSFPDLTKSDLFDHQKLATALSDSLEGEINANMLPITKIEYKNTKELLITAKGKQYIFNTNDLWK